MERGGLRLLTEESMIRARERREAEPSRPTPKTIRTLTWLGKAKTFSTSAAILAPKRCALSPARLIVAIADSRITRSRVIGAVRPIRASATRRVAV